MGFGELMLLAVGLSMDAFAVSVCKGLAIKRTTLKAGLSCGIWFGGFQAIMPLIGFFLGTLFAGVIQVIDHWIAFILLVMIGVNMLKEAFSKKSECDSSNSDADMSVKTMFMLAVATSIDALAVGISLAMVGSVNIFTAVTLIGAFTFLFCIAGVKVGSMFGSWLESKAQAAGGFILIMIGLKILLEHLGVLA